MSQSSRSHEHSTGQQGSRAVFDIGVAVVASVATMTQLSHGGVVSVPSEPGGLDLIGGMLAVCSAAPLVVSRRVPLAAFVASTALSAGLAFLGYPLDMLIAPAYALYRLAARRRSAAALSGGTIFAVLGMLGLFLAATAASRGSFPLIPVIHTCLVTAGAWFAGERTRLRHEQLEALQERARRAEHEADRERLLAVAEERTRIARELHDSAGHAISVIAVRAGGARLRYDTDPSAALPALSAIETLARETAEEIDQIVRSLRDDDRSSEGDVDTPPGLASLDTLVAQLAATGLTVMVDRSGAVRPLGVVEDRAAYRILQEALTNAARHGTGNAAVRLAYGTEELEVTVINSVSARTRGRAGGGHGIVGMHERATLLGGGLDTGRVGGRFRVRARLPYGAPRP